jgi:hypothetical protein
VAVISQPTRLGQVLVDLNRLYPLAKRSRLVKLIVAALTDIDARLIALEPCPGAPKAYNDKGHAWGDDGACARCPARKAES